MQEAKTATYPRPGASVVVFRGDEVLLVQRGKRPYYELYGLYRAAKSHGARRPLTPRGANSRKKPGCLP